MTTMTAVLVSCAACGETEPAEELWMSGALTVSGGLRSWTCATCTRRHLEEIEIRRGLGLPETWR